MANLGVFGLGYVGSVTAACFAVSLQAKEAQEVPLADSKGKEVSVLVGLPRLEALQRRRFQDCLVMR